VVENLLFAGRLIVWLLGGVLVSLTFMVTWDHLHTWVRKGKDKSRSLPLHVWTVALSYDLLVIALLTRTGPLDWRAFIYIPALLLGVFAMYVLVKHQRLVKEELG